MSSSFSLGHATKSMNPQVMLRSSVTSQNEDQFNGVERIMAEIKTESSETAVEDDLGFLHGMNINNLVRNLREFIYICGVATQVNG